MTFHIITIFPESIRGYFESSILKRAQKNKLLKIKFYNPRDFAIGKHKKVDDKQFGGGPGMVMRIEPIIKAIVSILNSKHEARNSKQIKNSKFKIILLSPSGKQFSQQTARSLAKRYKNIILISGHYEGIDERIKKVVSDFGFRISDLSIGPYVLTGGELPAAVAIDAISRQITGVLGKKESLEENRGIGIPVYTRPEVFMWRGKKYCVPKVLLSGHHKKIDEWRKNLTDKSNLIK